MPCSLAEWYGNFSVIREQSVYSMQVLCHGDGAFPDVVLAGIPDSQRMVCLIQLKSGDSVSSFRSMSL